MWSFARSLVMLLLVMLSPAAAHAKPLTMRDIDLVLGARDAGQWSEFLARVQAISAAHPNQPTFRYLLAQAYAHSGDGGSAIEQLSWLGVRGYSYAASTHPAFNGIRSTNSFVVVAAKLEENAAIEIGRAVPVLTFNRGDIRPEGVARDADPTTFLISSVGDGSIYAVSRRGDATAVWHETRAGRESVGVRTWPGSGNRAVFCSNSIQGGEAELIQLDLRTGLQSGRIALPRVGGGRNYCNDIALVEGGFAVTDSEAGTVWLIDANLTHARPLLDELLVYPNGIAEVEGDWVFVADMLGVNLVSVQTGRMRRIEMVDGLSLAGIDGLYFQEGRLVVVQNAISPERIVEIALGPNYELYSARVVAQGQAGFSDLTTAVVDGNTVFALSGTGIRHRPSGDAAFPQIFEISLSDRSDPRNQHGAQ